MKTILGLDLGVASIGWALTREDNGIPAEIVGMGSRIVPLSTDEKDEFESGNAISKNQKRTLKRTQRKGYDRYQLRKKYLKQKLRLLGMMPGEDLFTGLTGVELYGLRSKAVGERISLAELGRILFHLNQKRGYKSSRKDENKDKQETDYVAEVKLRHTKIKEDGLTIGQYFHNGLLRDERYRIKEQIFPREAYIAEFDLIVDKQKAFYPEILTEENIKELRDKIIYYQRPLKSQKGLVSICDFEGRWYKNKEGKEVFGGPKVAPRSSPLFQVCKIWETVNNIAINTRRGEQFEISQEAKREIFDYLDSNEKLSQTELFKILKIGKNDGYYGNKQLSKGLQGNLTRIEIRRILKDHPNIEQLTTFRLETEVRETVDKNTGEAITRRCIKPDFEKQSLYRLWHIIYSIPDEREVVKKLSNDFSIPADQAAELAKLDFTKGGFGNKSSKAIRTILPYLQDGFRYSDACTMGGYSHSDSLTKDENLARPLKNRLLLLPKNSLRQPVVEKVLNQMINVVNGIIDQYGKPDEIRVELARELKQSKEERNEAFIRLNKRERENKGIVERLEKEYQVKATRRNIQKWRLYDEGDGFCLYCGKKIELADFLNGEESDVEHILPKAKIFDDSHQNKILSHRTCNRSKNNMTAYDYMLTQSGDQMERYEKAVNDLFKSNKIGKSKRDKLLMTDAKIPQDFIARQLRETQYIARKSREILLGICRDVWATSGSVTGKLRHLWGWDDVLMNLQIDKYRNLGKTELIDYQSNGQAHKRERIIGWTKRDDHRHHSIDALTIACTQQGFIQRINTLNAKHTRDEMLAEVKDKIYNERLTLIEKTLISKRPFDIAVVERKAAQILVSYKAGKKVATLGKRTVKKDGAKIVIQKDIIIPRGPLSEDSVYGKIKRYDQTGGFEEKYVIKYKLGAGQGLLFSGKETIKVSKSGKEKNQVQSVLDSIVDKGVRTSIEKRLAAHDNNPKIAFQDLENNPVWLNETKKIPIRSVRCFTGLDAVTPVKYNEANAPIGFVKPGNNHHIAIYLDGQGKRKEHTVTFWDAVLRKKYGFPVIIHNPKEIWDRVLAKRAEYPEDVLTKLPNDTWTYVTSMQQNEMFIFNLSLDEIQEGCQTGNFALISENLFRVQKISSLLSGWWFRHHLETSVSDKNDGVVAKKTSGRLIVIQSLEKMNGTKIKLNALGMIVKIGE